MSPKRMVVVLTAVIAMMAVFLAPAAQADWTIGNCNGDTLVGNTVTTGATLTVDGSANTGGGATYGAQVCKSSQGLYNFMVGRLAPSGGGGYTINETGVAGDVGKVYALTFTLTGGDQPTSAEVYGNMTGYTIAGQTVTVTGTPGQLTQINYGGASAYAACNAAPFTGTYAGGLCAAIPCGLGSTDCVDDVATFHGSVRSAATASPTLSGMYISSAVNLYQVSLTNCAGVSYGRRLQRGRPATRQDGGANRPAPTLDVQMIGPHYKASSNTLNTGSLKAFIPFALMQACFGTDAATVAQQMGVTRAEGGIDTSLVAGTNFTVTAGVGGLTVSVPTITFSSPTYKISVPRSSSGTGSSASASASATKPITIGTVSWGNTKGRGSATRVVTATFAKNSTVKAYAIKAAKKKSSVQKSGVCAFKGAKVLCTVKGLGKGAWLVQITSTLKAGGAGPTATKTVSVT